MNKTEHKISCHFCSDHCLQGSFASLLPHDMGMNRLMGNNGLYLIPDAYNEVKDHKMKIFAEA